MRMEVPLVKGQGEGYVDGGSLGKGSGEREELPIPTERDRMVCGWNSFEQDM